MQSLRLALLGTSLYTREAKSSGCRICDCSANLQMSDLFRGLSALPAPCPYRAEQATSFAGGYDCIHFFSRRKILAAKFSAVCESFGAHIKSRLLMPFLYLSRRVCFFHSKEKSICLIRCIENRKACPHGIAAGAECFMCKRRAVHPRARTYSVLGKLCGN